MFAGLETRIETLASSGREDHFNRNRSGLQPPVPINMTEPITIDQVGCARCGGDEHPNITFLPLTLPLEIEREPPFTHWALCPANGEPILLQITESCERELAKDINGENCAHTQEELNHMIVVLEDTGRYDVVGRRW